MEPIVRGGISRKEVLGLAAGAAGGLALARGSFAALPTSKGSVVTTVQEIESILQAKGMASNGILSINIDRSDITNVYLRGVPIAPAFEINGGIFFQALGSGMAIMNGDMALKRDETNAFIDQMLAHNIIFQAFHQHFYDFTPPVWFMHFRAVGNPLTIARGLKAALNVTSTPFPQAPPSHPTTPLPAQEIGEILGGSPTIGSSGVVTVDVPRLDAITLGGVRISPFLNVQNTISFQPLSGGLAAAAPDFSMVSREVQNVMKVMRMQGWDIGCLYNQETDEQPQLFFSHQFKVGNPIALAREIRNGLDQTNAARGSNT